MNYKMTIQYDGGRYDGWQRQGNTQNTIQGKIEAILSKYAGEAVEIHGAGRTDAGVHAKGQVANFHCEKEGTTEELMKYLNEYLPHDIGILQVEEVPERFHSRLNAKEKIYVYQIGQAKEHLVFERKFLYLCEDALDVKKMKEAAQFLIGEHDFKSFCSNKKLKKSSVRNIKDIQIIEQDHKITITYRGDGFLYNMVRILTGTLMEVGARKKKPEEIKDILEARDRQRAGVTAPASGLCLKKVIY